MIICSPQYGLAPHSTAGGEVHDEQILKGLADAGHTVEIILPYDAPYDAQQKRWHVFHIPIPFIHTSYLFNIAIIPILYKLYKHEPFDILRIHSPYFVGIGAWIFKKCFAPHMPLIATYHHLEDGRWDFRLIDSLFVNVWNHIVTDSNYTKQELQKRYNVPERRICTIYNAVDVSISPHKIHFPRKTCRLVFCGRLIPRKNISFLFKVLREMRGRAQLIIIGEGPQYDTLVKKAYEHQVREQVVFKGRLTEQEKRDVYRNAHIFVFPSLMEGFGLAPLEAMAHGIPTLVSNRGSLPEVVGEGGKILPLVPEMWAEAIDELCRNETLYLRLSQKAVKRAHHFTWENAVRETEKAFLSYA